MHAPAPLIVSAETAGLGNRLKSWVSAMRISPHARVHWAVNDNMPATFVQLFATNHALDSIPDGATVYKSWRLVVLPEDEQHLPNGFATVGAGAHPLVRAVGKAWWNLRGRPDDRYRFMLFPKQHSKRSTRADARHIDLEYERIPSVFSRPLWPTVPEGRRAPRDRGARRRVSRPPSTSARSVCRFAPGATTRGASASIIAPQSSDLRDCWPPPTEMIVFSWSATATT